jgi:hypothetical protein
MVRYRFYSKLPTGLVRHCWKRRSGVWTTRWHASCDMIQVQVRRLCRCRLLHPSRVQMGLCSLGTEIRGRCPQTKTLRARIDSRLVQG